MLKPHIITIITSTLQPCSFSYNICGLYTIHKYIYLGEEPSNYQELTFPESNSTSGQASNTQLSNGSLLIRQAVSDDQGYYLCHSTNGIGAGLSKVILLTVHSKCSAAYHFGVFIQGGGIAQLISHEPLNPCTSQSGDPGSNRCGGLTLVTQCINKRGRDCQL